MAIKSAEEREAYLVSDAQGCCLMDCIAWTVLTGHSGKLKTQLGEHIACEWQEKGRSMHTVEWLAPREKEDRIEPLLVGWANTTPVRKSFPPTTKRFDVVCVNPDPHAQAHHTDNARSEERQATKGIQHN